ncbi:hypothetical protein BGZ60DRAFT_159006 [Tricladium varicosporioides]|nr:hypothetical protein BGZ60DRAFT_159006 [Hymenoscyphus varicosporioides]
MTQTNQPANSNNSLHPVLPVRAPGGASPTTNEHVDQYAQNAVNEGKQISALLAEILKTSSVAGNAESNLHLVLSLAEDLRNYQSPIEFSIGLVGDSGVGKSSLINSLLDTNDLAKTAGNGSACTTVVTEYRQKRPCDTAPFTIEVQCMEDQEIQDLLQQCIVDYRRYHLLDRSGIEAPERSEIERLGAKAKLAWDTILAAFGDYNECCEERFQDPHNETDAIILMVLGWKDQIPWSQNGLHNRITSLTATEEKQCSIQIEECLKSLKWPFIKVVRIYLEAKVLEKGIVLVDLPGSSTLILPSSFYIRP